METISYASEVKANKEHRCDFCSEKIAQGETYLKSTHKNDGDVYDWKTHKYCGELATKLKMYDNADEGVTQDFFMESVEVEYINLMIDLFPREEHSKYINVFQQLRCVRWHDKLFYVIRHYAKIEREQNPLNPSQKGIK